MAFFFSCKEQPFLPLLMRWQQATVFREFKRRRRRKGKGEGEEGTKRGRGREKKEGGSERERERELLVDLGSYKLGCQIREL